MPLPQDVLEELELLRSMYEDAELTIAKTVNLPFSVSLRARPYVAFNEAHVFCSLDVVIKMGSSYPSSPATVEISCSRGLDDAQMAALQKEMAESASNESQEGSVHLWLLVTKIRDQVTEANKPNQCPVCCDQIDIKGVSAYGCVRLEPCWHAMHAGCFRDYLIHQGFERDEKEKRLTKILGSIGAHEKAWENWICCPICRISIDLKAANELVSGFMNSNSDFL